MAADEKNIAPEFNDESATTRPDAMTEAEYTVAFARMARDYFSGASSAEPPALFYVTGLPGAGKSTFIEGQKKERPEMRDYVHINFDDLRVYHPRYQMHVQTDPLNAAARIDTAVERLIGWLAEEAARRHLNVLLDDAAMGRDMTRLILSPFQAQGYEIDATIVATPSSVARQDVHLRFEENFSAARNGQPVIPRWVNTAEQDNAPAALVETAETLEGDRIASRLKAIDRTGKTLSEGKGTAAAVRAEMTRELTPAEKADYQAKAGRIAAFLNGRMKGTQPNVAGPQP